MRIANTLYYFCTRILVLYIVLLSISLPSVAFGNTGKVSYYFPRVISMSDQLYG